MKFKVLKRIKTQSTEGLAAHTDIVVIPINGEDTIHIIQTFLSRQLQNPLVTQPIAKRGDLIIYRTSVAMRQSTLLDMYSYLKSIIEPCK